MLHVLPVAGERIDLVGGCCWRAFFNLIVVAVLAPLAGLACAGAAATCPAVVAADRAGTALLVRVALRRAWRGGLAHRPAVERARRDVRRAGRGGAPLRAHPRRRAMYRAHLARPTRSASATRLYRTCVPGDDPDRALCLFVVHRAVAAGGAHRPQPRDEPELRGRGGG